MPSMLQIVLHGEDALANARPGGGGVSGICWPCMCVPPLVETNKVAPSKMVPAQFAHHSSLKQQSALVRSSSQGSFLLTSGD